MVFRVAVGDGDGLLIAVRPVVATQGKAGRIEMLEAQLDAFLDTDGHGSFAAQQSTAIRVDLLQRTAELKAVKHLRPDTLTKQQVERCIGKKLRG